MSEEQRNTRILSRYNLLSLYLPAATLALGSGIAAPAIPVFAKHFEVSFGVASLVFVVHMLGALASTLPTGLLVDHIGRRKIVLAGPLLVGLSSLLTATAGSFPELLLWRFAGGWAQQMWMLGRLAMIADTGGDRQRGRQITGMLGMETTGRLLGPALGGFLAAAWDIRAPFVAHAVLSVASVVPSYKLVRETAPKSAREEAAREDAASSTGARATSLLAIPVLIFFFAQFMSALARGTLFGGTVNLYPVYAYGIGPETLGLISTLAGVIGIPIVFSTGAIMDRFGRKWTVVPGFAMLGIALAFTAYTAYAHLPFETFLVAFVWFHAAQNITSGNMQVIGSDIAPVQSRGKFFGVWRLIGEVGQVVSPAAFAFLAETYEYGASFVFLSASAFGTALVLGFLVKETLAKQRGETSTVAGVTLGETALATGAKTGRPNGSGS